MRTAADVEEQLEAAGLMPYVLELYHGQDSVSGRMKVATVLFKLESDPRFSSGLLYQLHRDVGTDLTEFRAYPGELGPGSLQIVIDKKTGKFHADIDKFDPYADVVNIAGHAFVEVLPYWFKGLGKFLLPWRKKKKGKDNG